jgi:hypothetical protein
MKFLCFMCLDEKAGANVPQDLIDKGLAECKSFFEWLANTGRLLAVNTLQPAATAKTVRVRDGKMLVTDGPFAETKEVIGGYFLIEAHDQNEANEIASRVPGAQWGSVEVRLLDDAGS